MYWGVLTADFRRFYTLDLGVLMVTEGEFDRLVTLLTNLPSEADFYQIDTSNVVPKKYSDLNRNRPLNPGEYRPIEEYASTWAASGVT